MNYNDILTDGYLVYSLLYIKLIFVFFRDIFQLFYWFYNTFLLYSKLFPIMANTWDLGYSE